MGSFPKTDALAAAWHTRPSVVSPQSADAAALARLQSCAICLATSRCCLNHSSIDCFEALETSPAPASRTFLTIGLGDSTFLQAPGIIPTKRLATTTFLSFTSSSTELVFFLVGRHMLLAKYLLASGRGRLFLLDLLRLIGLFTL